MTVNADDFFAGGAVSAKFDTAGLSIGGAITRVGEPQQQRDFTTQALKTWDDGRPMMQLPVDVATDLRDPEQPDDDGTRTFYIRGEMQKAVRLALRQSGEKGLREGGILTITYSGDGPVKQRGMNPPKLYSATYQPPAVAKADGFINEPSTNSTTAAPAPAAVAAAPPADTLGTDPRLAHLTPEQLAGARAAGWTAEVCASMFPAPTAA